MGYAVDSHAYPMWWLASNLPLVRKALAPRGLGQLIGLAPPKTETQDVVGTGVNCIAQIRISDILPIRPNQKFGGNEFVFFIHYIKWSIDCHDNLQRRIFNTEADLLKDRRD
jgi:hypothetical protein